ncbi:hypothetical protein EDD18DRAFT_1116928 [Armillaria luteobubalina]|uniref:Uncharacterized protein n=1 Tax=Armillaria luteobubalina TaxID=153913 RepID=A0AA39T9K2_9AGAR|nr:hypothetical protein EDD18DRAFT_1116928 [Armillaria luteobubalina]
MSAKDNLEDANYRMTAFEHYSTTSFSGSQDNQATQKGVTHEAHRGFFPSTLKDGGTMQAVKPLDGTGALGLREKPQLRLVTKDWSDWVRIWQDLPKGFHHLSYVPAIFSSSHHDVAATSTDFERAILDDEPTLILETAADVSLDIDLGDDGFVFDDDEDEADEDEEPEEPSAEVD